MKVGVITPSYNDAKYIGRAIESVLNQTSPAYCHYIYSDASTDESIDIIRSYAKKYNQCHIIGEKNQGQAHARNILINKARQDGCDIVAFLDSDDRWYSDHISSNLSHLVTHDVVYSDPEYEFENGQIAYPTGFILPAVAIPKTFLYTNFIFISTALARISCFDQVNYDSDLNSIEDWDAWLQIYQKGYTFVKRASPRTAVYIVKLSGNSSSQGPTKQQIIRKKHRLWNTLRLNIGNQIECLDDYINISAEPDKNADCVYSLPSLPYDIPAIDEIRVQNLIETLGYHGAAQAIQNWHSVMRPGARLIITTPDFLQCCDNFVRASVDQQIELYRLFFGDPYNTKLNKFLFTEQQLRMHLSWAGFTTIERRPSLENYLTLEAVK